MGRRRRRRQQYIEFIMRAACRGHYTFFSLFLSSTFITRRPVGNTQTANTCCNPCLRTYRISTNKIIQYVRFRKTITKWWCTTYWITCTKRFKNINPYFVLRPRLKYRCRPNHTRKYILCIHRRNRVINTIGVLYSNSLLMFVVLFT